MLLEGRTSTTCGEPSARVCSKIHQENVSEEEKERTIGECVCLCVFCDTLLKWSRHRRQPGTMDEKFSEAVPQKFGEWFIYTGYITSWVILISMKIGKKRNYGFYLRIQNVTSI